MADPGIIRVLASKYWLEVVFPAFKKKYPTDAKKIEAELLGDRRPWPASAFAKGIVEEIRSSVVVGPPPPPPPAPVRLAPQTYNKGASSQDARYCINAPGVYPSGPDRWTDEGGFQYDGQGLSLGGRSGNLVAGLKPSDEMDGKEPCEPYGGYPPWPRGSYNI